MELNITFAPETFNATVHEDEMIISIEEYENIKKELEKLKEENKKMKEIILAEKGHSKGTIIIL